MPESFLTYRPGDLSVKTVSCTCVVNIRAELTYSVEVPEDKWTNQMDLKLISAVAKARQLNCLKNQGLQISSVILGIFNFLVCCST